MRPLRIAYLSGPVDAVEVYRAWESRKQENFFGTVSLRFRVDDSARSYHVPLLVAPYSVSSYRGS